MWFGAEQNVNKIANSSVILAEKKIMTVYFFDYCLVPGGISSTDSPLDWS